MAKNRILFSKAGTARYISHLDLMRTLQRAFFRADITIAHTEGFHPHPYTAIPLPLPLGFSSDCELMEFGLMGGATVETLPALLTAALPDGITVRSCYEGGLPFRRLAFVRYAVRLDYDGPLCGEAKAALEALLAKESHIIQKRSKKAKSGLVELDIIPQVRAVEVLFTENGSLHLQILLSAQNPGLNPELLLRALEGECPHLKPAHAAFHRMEILDDTLAVYR